MGAARAPHLLRRTSVLWLAAAWAAASGCGAALFVRPSGPSAPAPDAPAAWADATRACRAVRSYRAAIQLSARFGGRRVPRAAMGLALDAAGDIGADARISDTLVFRLGGTADRATLWLQDGNRVVTAPAADILDALSGARLAPSRLLAVMAGCVARDTAVLRAARQGDFMEIGTSDGDVFLDRKTGAWRARAGFFDGLVADYRAFAGDWPSDVAIGSNDGRTPPVSLSMRVDAPEVNGVIAPAAFAVTVPAGATTMSLQELRERVQGSGL